MSNLVWYASYGSNLSYDRFLCYLEGGKADGASGKQPGCTDPTEPREERAVFIPHKLFFARNSRQWKGSVAFLDPRPTPASKPAPQTWGRAYLLTKEQCADIFRQENKNPELDLDWEAVITNGYHDSGTSWYNRLLLVEADREGHPMVTITGSDTSQTGQTKPPSEAYLAHIVEGLHDTYHLGRQGTVNYLKNIPGIKGAWSNKQLAKLWDDHIAVEPEEETAEESFDPNDNDLN